MPDSKEALENLLDKSVLIIVKGNVKIKGTLKGFDNHLNILLEDAEEIANETKNRKLGTLIIRGDGIEYIYPAE
ncbi:LSM domain-containing protein [Sulfolobus tengchongensis]|uniref:LSM domain-containing protein n=1 Tax=Sulfolobus tengchongensis TaxID=207809 RepID=A0AAX4L1X7_9CREN